MGTWLDAFLGTTDGGELVVGTYLYPYQLFGMPDWADDRSAAKVISRISVDTQEILVTCNGGLFVRPSEDLADPEKHLRAKLDFEERAASLFNRIICELALQGVVSEPASAVHISAGRLIDGCALIRTASGGREMYRERTIGPLMELMRGTWRTHPIRGLDVVEVTSRQECVTKLVQVSAQLPTLIPGAYSLYSRRQLTEALIDSWIVIEQLIDSLWSDYLSQIGDKARRDRLADTRAYTVAVRLEVLLTAGRLSADLYDQANAARKHRNDVAHRARTTLKMAAETTAAMRALLEWFCGKPVAPLCVSESVNW
jgi:hypothetical protein